MAELTESVLSAARWENSEM